MYYITVKYKYLDQHTLKAIQKNSNMMHVTIKKVYKTLFAIMKMRCI